MADRSAVSAWEALFRAQVAVMRDISAVFPSNEISINEYDVLFNLSRSPQRRLRLRALNQHILLSQPSVSRLVDRLAARGLLRKHEDPADGRGTIVELTAQGFDLFRRVAIRHMEAITERMRVLDADELEQLTALSDKLRRNEDGAGESRGMTF